MRKWIMALLILSLLCSITGCGENEEGKAALVFSTNFRDINLGKSIEERFKRDHTFAEIPVNLQLEGLWKEVIVPQIITDMDYLIYVDCQQLAIHSVLRRNISHGIVQDVREKGMEVSEFGVLELKRIIFWDGIYHAFLKSEQGNEIYMLLRKCGDDPSEPYSGGMSMKYIITVDFWTDGSAETAIWEGGDEGYNSALEWNSYRRLSEEEYAESKLEVVESCYLTHFDAVDYTKEVYYALYDFYERNGLDKEVTWRMDNNSVYINWERIVDVFLYNGEEEIAMLVDIWNRKYVVLR